MDRKQAIDLAREWTKRFAIRENTSYIATRIEEVEAVESIIDALTTGPTPQEVARLLEPKWAGIAKAATGKWYACSEKPDYDEGWSLGWVLQGNQQLPFDFPYTGDWRESWTPRVAEEPLRCPNCGETSWVIDLRKGASELKYECDNCQFSSGFKKQTALEAEADCRWWADAARRKREGR